MEKNSDYIVCSNCGMKLPLNKFNFWKKKDGTITYAHTCRRCASLKHRKKINALTILDRLKDYSDKELIEELIRRRVWTKVEKIMDSLDC